MSSATKPPVARTAALLEMSSWERLWQAFERAAKGKRGSPAVAAFEFDAAALLLELQTELRTGTYRPGRYRHFVIREPKQRLISAAPFRDRVVHHALCAVIEARFERGFIGDSYANRVGRGTHRAVDRLQQFSRRYRYALRMDIVQHFPSIDHAILRAALQTQVPEADLMALIDAILASGADLPEQDYRMQWFPGDDLLAACRPRGLPIGNLTSQFWSNVYLHPLDLFVKRELGCKAYLRYADDFALFSDSKRELWRWKRAIVERLARLRLVIHDGPAQVVPVAQGIPWLGFVVYPTHRRLKGRKLRQTTKRLRGKYAAWQRGQISFAELDASVQGWVNHVSQADSWGLRKEVFRRMVAKKPRDDRLR
jgi:hypothetical protein